MGNCFVCNFENGNDMNFMVNGLYLAKDTNGQINIAVLVNGHFEYCPILYCPICGRELNADSESESDYELALDAMLDEQEREDFAQDTDFYNRIDDEDF